jgi:hypothetical protein
MARRAVASRAVTRQEFLLAYDWIRSNRDIGRMQLDCLRPFENVLDFLDRLKAQEWVADQDGEMAFEVDIPGLSETTTESLASDVRKYLREASVAQKLPNSLNLRYLGERRFSPYWGALARGVASPSSTQFADGPIFSRVAVFGKFWAAEFSAEVMRGITSMARELGLELADMRTSKPIKDCGPDYLIGCADAFDPQDTAILVIFDNSDQVAEQSEHLRNQGFYVIAIGHRQRALAIDNTELGKRLAEQCVADHTDLKTKSKRVACLFRLAEERDSIAHDYIIRTHGIKRELMQSGLFEIQDTVTLAIDHPPQDTFPHAIAAVEEALGQINGKHATALFPRLDAFTKIAIRFVYANRAFAKTRIYGEKLLPRDLAILSDPESPLAAVCGVDPYYYGRYALRAASSRRELANFPKVPPVLITKQDAVEQLIFSADRIPANFKGCDVRLNGRPFAWFDWMRERCPGSFGPDQRIAI